MSTGEERISAKRLFGPKRMGPPNQMPRVRPTESPGWCGQKQSPKKIGVNKGQALLME